MKKIVGLDLGIASVGWCIVQSDDEGNILRIEDMGSYVFNNLEDKNGKLENAARGEKRRMRRQRRRKQHRLIALKKIFEKENVCFDNIDARKYASPFELKIRGLNEKLSKEELFIALYHYMKYRGFKSSRKVEDKKKDGVLLDAIEEVRGKLSEDYTITQYILDSFQARESHEKRIHNAAGQYFLTVSRDMYLKEINQLLDKQIEYQVVDSDFKVNYLSLFNRQRDFSEGPNGKYSPYGVENGSLIAKMVGKCDFDGQMRAPKNSFSAESFRLLSFLNNLKYKKTIENQYVSLTPEQIKCVYEYCLKKTTLTYKKLFELIKITPYRIKGLEATRKDYITKINKFKSDNSITADKLTGEELVAFNEYLQAAVLENKINVTLTNYHKMKNAFEKQAKINENISKWIENPDFYDTISEILLLNKTDERIKQACKERGLPDYIADIATTMLDQKNTINLSLDICRRLIPHLLNGMTYDEAMSQLGYNHTRSIKIEKCDYLPDIDSMLKGINVHLTNANVRHALVFMRQIVNEILKKYGEIDEYHIELTRELKMSFQLRGEYTRKQRENMEHNNFLKAEMVRKYPHAFSGISRIKYDDLIKYKLFVEQGGRCAYSNKQINENYLFDDNLYQIDHILPYSRSYDDSLTNKVLVYTERNQKKGNKTPKEAFNKEEFKNILDFISISSISNKKRDKLLANEIDSDFIERNKVDSSYIAVLGKKLIESYLQKPVICPNGSITNKLKMLWGLKGYTHSYLSDLSYRNIQNYIYKRANIEKKSITFEFVVEQTKKEVELKIEKVTSDKRALESSQMLTNEMIDFVNENSSLVLAKLKEYENKDISLFIENTSEASTSQNHEYVSEMLTILATNLSILIFKDRTDKDRSNHLHHALDAAVIACTNQKLIYRITKFYQEKEDRNLIDEETGEVFETVDRFPLPYKEFRHEVLARVYERDSAVLLEKLNSLDIYKDKPLERRDVQALLPARHPSKYKKGAYHAETILGEKAGVITKRIPIEKVSEKDLENLFAPEKRNGVSPFAETIKAWRKEPNDTRTKYPYHPGTGNPIKSIKIEVTKVLSSKVKIKEKRFAENDTVIKVNVYKKDNEDKLYFVPVYYVQEVKASKGEDVTYNIIWGSGDNHDYICKQKLELEYRLVCSLPRNTLIEVEMKNGNKGICYSGGCTSGRFEVYSILGDSYDIFMAGLISSPLDRIRLSISTIKSIKVRNISILGKLS